MVELKFYRLLRLYINLANTLYVLNHLLERRRKNSCPFFQFGEIVPFVDQSSKVGRKSLEIKKLL